MLLSSSDSWTLPADQLLVGFAVVAENAEYDACQTKAADTPRPASRAPTVATWAVRRRGREEAGMATPFEADAKQERAPVIGSQHDHKKVNGE
ncbi:hypothetical protein GCM10027572_23020 [Flexivirga lutea]